MGSDTAHDRRRDLTGWDIAATLGLLVAAFVVERLVPAENEDASERNTKEAASAVRTRQREKTAAGLRRRLPRYP